MPVSGAFDQTSYAFGMTQHDEEIRKCLRALKKRKL
jgi:hypothetical protein